MCLRELKVGGFIFIRALFTITKRQKPSKCPLMDEWINKTWYIHSMDCYVPLIGGGNTTACNNMNEPEGHYAK